MGDAVPGRGLDRADGGVLDPVLCQGEIAGEADQRGEHGGSLVADEPYAVVRLRCRKLRSPVAEVKDRSDLNRAGRGTRDPGGERYASSRSAVFSRKNPGEDLPGLGVWAVGGVDVPPCRG